MQKDDGTRTKMWSCVNSTGGTADASQSHEEATTKALPKRTPKRRRNESERQVRDSRAPWMVEESTLVLALLPPRVDVHETGHCIPPINPIYLEMSGGFLFLITKELQLKMSPHM